MQISNIKSKISSNWWNPEKDLQATTHCKFSTIRSDRSSSSDHDKYLTNTHAIKNSYSHSSTADQQINQFSQLWNQQSEIRKSSLHSQQYQITTHHIGKYKDHFNVVVSQFQYKQQQDTPLRERQFQINVIQTQNGDSKNEKFLSYFRKRVIKNLDQIGTIQSKCMVSATPHHILQQSQIVFKGSRDVPNIVPVKLVYQQDNEDTLHQHKSSQIIDQVKNKQQNQFNFLLIKKSNAISSLILLVPSGILCSLVKLSKSFTIKQQLDSSLLHIYCQKKISNNKTYLFCQPFEYTVDQLIRYGKIQQQGIAIIWKHIQMGIKMLCEYHFNYFQVQGIQRTIFYVHGKFKFLPIFEKRKVCTTKNYQKYRQQIMSYLQKLVKNHKNNNYY